MTGTSPAAPLGDEAHAPGLQAAGSGRFRVTGEMTLATVAALRIEGRRAFAAASGELAVDLGGVSRADSAGLALLVDWLAWAAGAARKLHFTAVPATVAALAHLSDVENLLREGPEPSAPASTTTP